ncbi:MAG: hypothetical protein ACI4MK_12465, partial [Aristaeellaceae bacterium]
SAFGSGPKGRGFESRHFDARKPLQRKGFRFFVPVFTHKFTHNGFPDATHSFPATSHRTDEIFHF